MVIWQFVNCPGYQNCDLYWEQTISYCYKSVVAFWLSLSEQYVFLYERGKARLALHWRALYGTKETVDLDEKWKPEWVTFSNPTSGSFLTSWWRRVFNVWNGCRVGGWQFHPSYWEDNIYQCYSYFKFHRACSLLFEVPVYLIWWFQNFNRKFTPRPNLRSHKCLSWVSLNRKCGFKADKSLFCFIYLFYNFGRVDWGTQYWWRFLGSFVGFALYRSSWSFVMEPFVISICKTKNSDVCC